MLGVLSLTPLPELLLSLHPMMCWVFGPLPPLPKLLLSLNPMMCWVFCALRHCPYFRCYFIQRCAGCSSRYPTAHTCTVTPSNDVLGVLPVTPLPIFLLSLHPMMCWVFYLLPHCPYFCFHFIQWCAGCSTCYPTAHISVFTSSNDVLGAFLSVTLLPILLLSLHSMMCWVFCPLPHSPYFCWHFIQWCDTRNPTAHMSAVTSSNAVLGVLPVTPLHIFLLSLHPMMCWVFCPLPHCPYFCCQFIQWCAVCSARYPTAHTSVVTSSNYVLPVTPTTHISVVTSSDDVLPVTPLPILLLSLHPVMCWVFCPLPHCPYFCCHFIQWCAARYPHCPYFCCHFIQWCAAPTAHIYVVTSSNDVLLVTPTAHTFVVTSSNDVLGVLPVTPLPILRLSLHPMMCLVFCALPHCPYFCGHFIQWCAGWCARYPTAAHTSVVTSSNDVLPATPTAHISVVTPSNDVLDLLPVTPLPILLLLLHPMMCWMFYPLPQCPYYYCHFIQWCAARYPYCQYFCCHFIKWCAVCSARYPTAHISIVISSNDVLGVLPVTPLPMLLLSLHQWCAGCSARYPTTHTYFVTSSNDVLPVTPLPIFLLRLHLMMCWVFCPSPHCPYFCCHFIQWCAGCSARYPTAHTSFVTSFNDVLCVLPVTPLPTCLLSLHPMMCWVFCPLPHCPYFCCHFIHWCAGCSVRYPTAHTSVDTSSYDVMNVSLLPIFLLSLHPVMRCLLLPLPILLLSLHPMMCCPLPPLPIFLLSLHPMICCPLLHSSYFCCHCIQ